MIIEKNKIYYLSADVEFVRLSKDHEKVVALSLDCLYECTWNNVDVNDVDYDMIPVFTEGVIRYVWPYELKEIKEKKYV